MRIGAVWLVGNASELQKTVVITKMSKYDISERNKFEIFFYYL